MLFFAISMRFLCRLFTGMQSADQFSSPGTRSKIASRTSGKSARLCHHSTCHEHSHMGFSPAISFKLIHKPFAPCGVHHRASLCHLHRQESMSRMADAASSIIPLQDVAHVHQARHWNDRLSSLFGQHHSAFLILAWRSWICPVAKCTVISFARFHSCSSFACRKQWVAPPSSSAGPSLASLTFLM